MTTILAFIAILAVVYRALTPNERVRTLNGAVDVIQGIRTYGHQELEPFWNALHARTPTAFVTSGLVAVNVAIFFCMLLGAGSLSDPATLVGWGASIGLRTTNGEWWRLITSPFVHSGFIALAVNAVALLQVGFLLERLVGRFAFSATYATAAILAGVENLRGHSLAVGTGASGGLCGLYGLLFVSVVGGWLHRSDRTIPLVAVVRLVPVTGVFVIFNLADPSLGRASEFVGVAAGLVFAIVVAMDVSVSTPPGRRVGVALATALTLAVVSGAPLGGITDVRPEMQRLVDLEHHTGDRYQAALGAFKKNGTEIEGLAQLIERSIVPELHEADERVRTLSGVPDEDQWRIADAREYLRLRSESWRLRAQGLREMTPPVRATAKTTPVSSVPFSVQAAARHRSSILTIGKAEAAERTALQVLDRIKA